MPLDKTGAQRASLPRQAVGPAIRRSVTATLASIVALGALASPTASGLAAATATSSVAPTTATSQLAGDAPSLATSVALADVAIGDVQTTASSLPGTADPAPIPLSEPAPTPPPTDPPAVPAADPTAEPSPTPEAPVEPPAEPARAKVVIVVGPVGGQTGKYIRVARRIAASARTYGAQVVELYSPNATWSRVEKAADGANVLVYIGHGNGWPSGHGPFDPDSKNGMGLNARAGAGNHNTRYYGESYIARSIDLAEDAVVILNRLCYASGNNEWGRGNPTRATAVKRVDNYGAGFLRAGAAAVFAEGITDARYILRGLFRTDATMEQIFWSSPDATGRYDFSFASRRTDGATALLDPYARSRYYRSVIGDLGVTAADWR